MGSRILDGQRPAPRLQLVRAADPPPLELPSGEVLPKLRARQRWDAPAVGAALAASLLAAAVLLAIAMGWLTF